MPTPLTPPEMIAERAARSRNHESPRISSDGTKKWFRHGKLHREDGPAIEWFGGDKEWWLNGRRYTKSEWLRKVLKDHPLTSSQRRLLDALSENWEGTPDALYEVVLQLSNPVHVTPQARQ